MIQFSNPAALWLLSLLVPLLLLYLLKRKRREVRVPSLLLWKQALEDTRATTPFQKLRSSLLLLLQILILVLATAALAKPYISRQLHQHKRWILVLDTSAGMETNDVTPNRFAVARKQLLDAVDSIPDDDEIMLVSFSLTAAVQQSFTTNKASIRKKVKDLEPDDLPTNWEPLFLILDQLYKQKPKPEIIIASDFSGFQKNQSQRFSFRPLASGRSGENTGLTRAALQASPTDIRQRILFYELKNFGSSARRMEVSVSFNKRLLDAYELQLQPFAIEKRSLEFTPQEAGALTIQLKPDDTFSQDNDLTITIETPRKIAVKNTIASPFIEKAVAITGTIESANNGEIEIASAGDSNRNGTGLYFHQGPGKTSVSRPAHWNPSHPVLRFVDVALWEFENYAILPLTPGAESLIETEEGVIAYAVSEPVRRIEIGFPLEKSNIPQLGGFPIFLKNAIEWLHAGRESRPVMSTTLIHPREGAYRDEQREFFVNFLDQEESNITPESPAASAGGEIESSLLQKDLTFWFLIAMIALLMFEWYAFHRRVDVAGA